MSRLNNGDAFPILSLDTVGGALSVTEHWPALIARS